MSPTSASIHPSNQAIIAIIKGGLGNQLFIYAAARALALRTQRQLYLDTIRGYIRNSFQRQYRLGQFPIVAEPMPEPWRIAPTLRYPRHRLLRAWNKLLPRDWRGYVAERWDRGAHQLTTLRPQRAKVTLLGHWQDEEYFRDFSHYIYAELAPPAPQNHELNKLGDRLAGEDSVALHIRRVRYEYRLRADYYERAIAETLSEFPNAKIYLFGDDLDWAIKSIHGLPAQATICSHDASNELVDFWLMTRCKHVISANSSYSWWAAWLGAGHRGGRVWAPRQSGYPLVPASGWLTLENEFDTMLC